MLGIMLDRQSEIPLKRQMYASLKEQMINGRLKEGETLPSTRVLARHLNVSRNTVCEAYDMLNAEGYTVSRQGAPTRVAPGVAMEKRPVLSPRNQQAELYNVTVDFSTGRPDLNRLPKFAFLQALHSAAGQMPLKQYGYTGPEGMPELREEIAAWLFRMRGLTVDPQDIFITSGATHALHVIAAMLYEKEGKILLEDPCHTVMLQSFTERGYLVVPVPVDALGMQTHNLTPDHVCGIYVTPSHQFPLGGILPAGRRAALIRYARQNECYIIEDDYDSEFRYAGDPVAPLYASDPYQVIYVGTFSKILFPSLRIGYVILPRPLHRRWRSLRTYMDVQNPSFEQAALTEFLKTRRLDRHIQKMRRLYGDRRKILLHSLSAAFGNTCRPWGDAAGLHLSAAFEGMSFDNAFFKHSLRQGVRAVPVLRHCIQKGRHTDKLLLGYGHLEAEEIEKGVRILHDIISGWAPKAAVKTSEDMF